MLPEAEAPRSDAAPAVSPLAMRFDGDPSGGTVPLVETRCGPGCLRYPKGWLSTDDVGFVYAWLFRGAFGTAEVMRCPLTRLDDRLTPQVCGGRERDRIGARREGGGR